MVQEGEEGQTYTNGTFGYSFVAPKGATVSAPQNLAAGRGASQQVTWVYLGDGTAISINVFLDGSFEAYGVEAIAKDPSFKKTTIGSHEAWQSESSSGDYQVLTTVFFGPSYIFEFQYGGNALSPDARATLDRIIQSVTFAK